ncbi:MAG TPA: (2Fe-2S) ferredoxin domain-containing protein [Chloroflexota bacterium]|nr:(2Fe-2S) ferredoxin domain-containing protein [Chloroflexota bacterium]
MAKRYVLVCRGPTCKAQGSLEVREYLRKLVSESGRCDVLVLPYTCFDLCGRGPNAVVYPEGVWYEALRVEDVPDLARHALGGPPAGHLLAEVDADHAKQCYAIFEEAIPELEAQAEREAKKRPVDGLFGLRSLFGKRT